MRVGTSADVDRERHPVSSVAAFSPRLDAGASTTKTP